MSLRFASGPNKGSIGAFYSRFRNYLTEYNTGRLVDDDDQVVASGTDDALNEAVYHGVRAGFYGIELDSKWRVYEHGAYKVDVSLVGDYTHARNIDTGQPLRAFRRCARPSRWITATARSARAEMEHAWAQHRVPEDDLPIASYIKLGMMFITYKFHVGTTHWLAYVRSDNLTNQDIRYASSVVRDIALEGGRSVMVGLRTTF